MLQFITTIVLGVTTYTLYRVYRSRNDLNEELNTLKQRLETIETIVKTSLCVEEEKENDVDDSLNELEEPISEEIVVDFRKPTVQETSSSESDSSDDDESENLIDLLNEFKTFEDRLVDDLVTFAGTRGYTVVVKSSEAPCGPKSVLIVAHQNRVVSVLKVY